MQDMIFAGGDGEAPRRYAEVEVVLSSDHPAYDPAGADAGADGENPSRKRGQGVPAGAEQPAGFSELSIRRRLERNGDGEYRLNGARCRLVDVIEALADANLGHEMHSVISQGRVEEIVHSRPRERRPSGRGGGRPWQAPQAPPAGTVEARANAGQPGPRARRRTRGAQPPAPAEAPGAGRGHPRAPGAPIRRAPRPAPGQRAARPRHGARRRGAPGREGPRCAPGRRGRARKGRGPAYRDRGAAGHAMQAHRRVGPADGDARRTRAAERACRGTCRSPR